MHSDRNNLTYKRYEKFYACFDKPKQKEENVVVEKEVVKTHVKLKDLLFPNGCANRE